MEPHAYAALHAGSQLRINGKVFTVASVVIPADDIEDRMRHALRAARNEQGEQVIRDFVLHDTKGEEYVLKIRDQPTFFWNTKFGFRQEDLIEIEHIEVVS